MKKNNMAPNTLSSDMDVGYGHADEFENDCDLGNMVGQRKWSIGGQAFRIFGWLS